MESGEGWCDGTQNYTLFARDKTTTLILPGLVGQAWTVFP